MRLRKNVVDLTTAEKSDFVAALKDLKAKQIAAPDGSQISAYDQFVAIHLGVTRKLKNGQLMSFGAHNGAHQNAAFLPWHREYLRRIELELQDLSNNADMTIPYWDWPNREATADEIFDDSFMGGDATGPDVVNQFGFFGRTVITGPLAKANGWPIDPRVHRRSLNNPLEFGDELIRNLRSVDELPTPEDIDNLFDSDKDDYEAFREALETDPRLHNAIHGWVGGSMGFMSSPNDPIFLLNHANIDRLWALWQTDGHGGEGFYPDAGEPEGHNQENPMWPWDGGNTGVTTVSEIQALIPNFTDEVRPVDILDCRILDYGYVPWERVKAILDGAIERWKDRTGFLPDLSVHGNNFDWDTSEKLANSMAFGVRLIEPNKVANNRGHETNLVVALKSGVPGFPRMPLGGPFLPKVEIAEIAHWIDSGMPN